MCAKISIRCEKPKKTLPLFIGSDTSNNIVNHWNYKLSDNCPRAIVSKPGPRLYLGLICREVISFVSLTGGSTVLRNWKGFYLYFFFFYVFFHWSWKSSVVVILEMHAQIQQLLFCVGQINERDHLCRMREAQLFGTYKSIIIWPLAYNILF